MASSQVSTSRPIHYIWVGPPTTPQSLIPGHDIAGPSAMLRINHTNKIYLWCLKVHEKNFAELFKSHPEITVTAIEDYMQHFPEFENEKFFIFVNEISKTDLRVKDRVIIKDGFSLLLLYKFAGYILDTNILPLNNSEPFSLPYYPDVMIPAANDNPKSFGEVDCWILYAPQAGLPVTQKIFTTFLLKFSDAHSHNSSVVRYSEQYYQQQPVWTLLPLYAMLKNKSVKSWVFTTSDQQPTATIAELKLVKTFSNTHKFENRETVDSEHKPKRFGK